MAAEADDNQIQAALEYALEHLVKNRPNNPVEFVANKLLEFQRDLASNNPKRKTATFAAAPVVHASDEVDEEEDDDESTSSSVELDEDQSSGSEDARTSPSDTEENARVAQPPPGQMFMRGRRQSVSAETFQKMFAYPDEIKDAGKKREIVQKTAEQIANIRAAIGSNFMFKNLDEPQMQEVIRVMFEMKKNAGETIITQGDEGDNFYVIASGQCEVFVSKQRQPPVLVKTAGPGDSFGELALMYFCPRAATVKAKTDVALWAVDRIAFRTILMETTLQKRKLYESFLNKVPILSALNTYERSALADALEPSTFEPNAIIVRQGEPGDKFYIIEEGAAMAIIDRGLAAGSRVVDPTSGEVLKSDYGIGDYFGELSLLNDQPRACSVIATTRTRVLSLDRHSFKKLLGSCEKILRRNVDLYQSYSKAIADRKAEIRDANKLKEELLGKPQQPAKK